MTKTQSATQPLIQVRQLVKHYATNAGTHAVLRGIDLDIEKGDFVALLGPSGAGKTTFLNMVTGVDKPTSGNVTVDNVDIVNTSERRLARWRGRNIGIVFQFFQLLPTLTVVENVMVPMDLCNVHDPVARRDKALDLLERFDVAQHADKTPDMLSGGQQQRVAVARALANEPPIIIGDEPTGNLDRMSAAVVFEAFFEMQERGHTVIVVTHDNELVRGVPTVLRIKDGLFEQSAFKAAAKSTQTIQAIKI